MNGSPDKVIIPMLEKILTPENEMEARVYELLSLGYVLQPRNGDADVYVRRKTNDHGPN